MAQWEIFSNQARMTTAATVGYAVRESGTPNHVVEAVVTMPATAGTYPIDWFHGVIARWSDPTSFLLARFLYQIDNPEVELWEYTPNGAQLLMANNLRPGNLNPGTVHTLRVAVFGPDVAVYWNGELIGNGSPVLLTGTKVGIGAGENSMHGQPTWDNFAVYESQGSLGPRSATGTPQMTFTSVGAGTVPQTGNTATGAPALSQLTSTGAASSSRNATGIPLLGQLTSTGVASTSRSGTGAPSLGLPSVTSTASSNRNATGQPTLTHESTGTASTTRNATGQPVMEFSSVGGSSSSVTATGAPSLGQLTSTGVASTSRSGIGAPSLGTVTASGSASAPRTATGSPSLGNLTGTGAGQASQAKSGSGAPVLGQLTGLGTATTSRNASGSASLGQLTATGVASSPVPRSATGAASLVFGAVGIGGVPKGVSNPVATLNIIEWHATLLLEPITATLEMNAWPTTALT